MTTVSANPRLQVRCLETWDAVRQAIGSWNDLLWRSSSANLFLTWEWMTSWWDAFGNGQLRVLACFDDEGKPVALAPLCLTAGTGKLRHFRILRFIGDGSEDSANLGFIVARNQPLDIALAAVLDWLQDYASDWDLLELNTLAVESPVTETISEHLNVRGWRTAVRHKPHLVLPLASTWQEQLRRLSPSARSSLVRRIRRVEQRFQVCVRTCTTARQLPEFLGHLFRLHAMRWQSRGQSGVFSSAQRKRFYNDLASQLLGRGWLDLNLLQLDDEIVAAEFGSRIGDVRYTLQTGFDPRFRAYGVGAVLDALVMQRLVGSNLLWFDFLAGENDYKLRWKPDRRKFVYLCCARPRTKGAAILAMKRWSEAVLPRLSRR